MYNPFSKHHLYEGTTSIVARFFWDLQYDIKLQNILLLGRTQMDSSESKICSKEKILLNLFDKLCCILSYAQVSQTRMQNTSCCFSLIHSAIIGQNLGQTKLTNNAIAHSLVNLNKKICRKMCMKYTIYAYVFPTSLIGLCSNIHHVTYEICRPLLIIKVLY